MYYIKCCCSKFTILLVVKELISAHPCTWWGKRVVMWRREKGRERENVWVVGGGGGERLAKEHP